MTRTKSTPAGIYARISRDAEQEGLGVARQEEDCLALAAKGGFTVADVYVDNDISASTKSRKPRPAYERLLADVRAGRIGVVLAYSNSRLTRRPRELEDLIDLHAQTGVLIKTVVSGDDDLSTADGRMVARIKANVDAAEAERTAERVARAHKQLALDGRHNGPRPFGWDLVKIDNGPGVLRINPAEAAVVRECVQRVLAGEGLWKITRDLNERGVLTSTGKPWATQVLRRMLLRWRNCGVRTHRGKEVGRGQWEPIIDRATHERVVALLTDPARRANNRGTAVKYLLSNRALCGACGRPMVGTAAFTYNVKVPPLAGCDEPRTKERHYPNLYKCPHAGCMKVSRRMDDVDDFVEAVVVGVLTRDGVRILSGDPHTARAAEDRIEALEAKLALTADQFAEDVITADQLRRITERLRPQLDVEKQRLRRAQPDASLAEFIGSGPAEAWQAADVETRRHIMEVIGMVVTILPVGPGRGTVFDPESVRIEWKGAGA